jgi:hypothetical protein
VSYSKLEADRIVDTLERLTQRIAERFPGAGLQAVSAELTDISKATHARSLAIAQPEWTLRLAVAGIILTGLVLLVALFWHIGPQTKADGDVFSVVQGVEAMFNILILMGAALFFLVSIEERTKRSRAQRALHELRSIIHVIDMHQLTKDPWTEFSISQPKSASPGRQLSVSEMIQYLDFCSELLSLASKVAVLYSQSFPDPVVTETVNDLERTAASLAQKIWQKINILCRGLEAAGGAFPVIAPASPAPTGPQNAGLSLPSA